MAVCPSCSRENPENAVFCEVCGSLMSGAYTNTVPVEPAAVTRMRKIGGSGAMLCLAILQTLATVFSVPQVTTYSAGTSSSGASFGFHFNIPVIAVLLCISFWMLYYTCKKPAGQLLSTGGITLLRVILMIGMVLYVLAFALILAVSGLLAAFGLFSAYANDAFIPVSVILILLSASMTALVFLFLYCLFAYRFLGSVKQTATVGFPACRSAVPLAVFSILSGVASLATSALSFIFSEEINNAIFQLVYMIEDLLAEAGQDILFNARLTDQLTTGGLNSVLSSAAAVCGAVSAILIGVLALRYRASMRKAD